MNMIVEYAAYYNNLQSSECLITPNYPEFFYPYQKLAFNVDKFNKS